MTKTTIPEICVWVKCSDELPKEVGKYYTVKKQYSDGTASVYFGSLGFDYYENNHNNVVEWLKPVKQFELTEEYKERICIEFAEWLTGLGYEQYDGVGRWISQHESGNKVFTTKQLYERFLKNN